MSDMYHYNLGQLFQQLALTYPDRIAIRPVEGRATTYKELNDLSNTIANYLSDRGVQRNDVVTILNNKTAAAYAIMIACVKIGAIYSNLDPKSPIERFNRMMDICCPKLLFHYPDEHAVITDYTSDQIELVDYHNDSFDQVLSNYPDH
ncbi:MAG: AMP-binding protein, partial [Flavobacteriales bacterium]|nr:AMP-binding protein [Flavobacteriales bacterium]